MKNLFIDLRYSYYVSIKSGKFNGGNNYCRRLVDIILNKENKNVNVYLCCYSSAKKILKENFNCEYSKIVTINNLSELDIKDGDIYFVPQVDDSLKYARELKKMKNRINNLKIYVTIHDTRYKELKYDKYDGILKSGIKRNPLILAIGRNIRSINIDMAMKIIMKNADEVFTVSNYSMQRLLNTYGKVNIKYFIQNPGKLENNNFNKINNKESYILFVSAGRSEKNFVRTFIAYKKYIDNGGRSKLVITGIKKEQFNIIKKRLKIDTELDNNVIIKDYVSDRELDQLFYDCRYLLFTSRNEGFGLPVLEAIAHEKPVVVSNKSSIPEVAGSAAVYVNPYSIKSIMIALEYMDKQENYDKELKYVKERKKIIYKQIELDEKILIDKLMEG